MSYKLLYVPTNKVKLTCIVFLTVALFFSVSGAAQASKLIPLPAGFNQGLGRAINESDQVVGVMWSGTGVVHPWVPFIYYNDGGTAQALAGYNPARDYEVQDLSNAADLVIGYYRDTVTPWVWDPVNLFSRSLPFIGYDMAYAVRIVESEGLILGYGVRAGSSEKENIQWELVGFTWVLTDEGEDLARAFNRNNINSLGHHSGSTWSSNPGWKPIIKSNDYQVPEPASLILLVMGLAALAVHAGRRSAKR